MLNNLSNVCGGHLVCGGAGIRTLYDLIVVLTHGSLMKRQCSPKGKTLTWWSQETCVQCLTLLTDELWGLEQII